MGKGGDTTVQQQSTLNKEQRQLAGSLINLIAPETLQYDRKGRAKGTGVRTLAQPEFYEGQRYAPYDQQYLGMGQQALQGMMGGMEDVFKPIYDYTSQMWNEQIAPQTMERFAGMGAAQSGGAADALARAGQGLTMGMGAQLAPMYLQNLQQLPGQIRAQGSLEQQLAQQPLDIQKQQWLEQQPYQNPYLGMTQSVLPYGSPWVENYAQQQPASMGYSALTAMAPALGSAIGGPLLGGLGSLMGGLF